MIAKISIKGFVLFATLIFLQLFSLLGLYGLMSITMMMQVARDHWQKQLQEVTARKILRDLKQEISIEDSHCIMPIISPALLAKKPLSWWQAYTCSGNLAGNQYYYALELMGSSLSVTHYRISLLLLAKKPNSSILLQASGKNDNERKTI